MSATLKKGMIVINSVPILLDHTVVAVAPGTSSMKIDFSVTV